MENTPKTYPSQVNTKAMACRVPAGDYVQFLQDAISKGISMNDWLLMKVYQEANNNHLKMNGIELHNSTKELKEEDEEDINDFPIIFNNGYGNEITFNDRDDVIFNIKDLLNKYFSLCEELGGMKARLNNSIFYIDINDRNNRVKLIDKLTSYLRTLEYEDEADKRADLREFKVLAKELFLDE